MLVKLLCNIANDVVFTRDKSIVSVSVTTIDCPYQSSSRQGWCDVVVLVPRD